MSEAENRIVEKLNIETANMSLTEAIEKMTRLLTRIYTSMETEGVETLTVTLKITLTAPQPEGSQE